MESRLLYGFIAGFAFMFIPLRSDLFEGITHFMDTLLYFVGLVSAIIFGAILIWNAFKNLKSATR
ncbi:hypothetical protein CEY16_13210 [Halalkalibacillus sediminis]|uniref:Uncharacterized protein n=1 Tax=Halalkalibacillus sediminis TaxID=2018042 RepID=A0A2I0QR24_9BACI|nr:hypothetical protein [Halalkalibacillus sediminis]PKR76773.1 hypothetical protein CEY16_13210 [Halalkalibacillus sediminis]